MDADIVTFKMAKKLAATSSPELTQGLTSSSPSAQRASSNRDARVVHLSSMWLCWRHSLPRLSGQQESAPIHGCSHLLGLD